MSDNFLNIKEGASFDSLSAEPLNPKDGDIYYDKTLKSFRSYVGGAWFDLNDATTDLGTVSSSEIIFDFEKSKNYRLLLSSTNLPFVKIILAGGTFNTDYTVAINFAADSNYATPLIFREDIKFANPAPGRLLASPGETLLLRCVKNSAGFYVAVQTVGAASKNEFLGVTLPTTGAYNTFGYVLNGDIYIAGYNGYGQFGESVASTTTSGPDRIFPASPMSSGRKWGQVSFGSNYVCALEKSTGFAWAWGTNTDGQLGTGLTTSTSSPVSVLGGRSYSKIYAGYSTVVAIEGSTGQLWAWGSNNSGQLGSGNRNSYSSPTLITSGRSFKQVAFDLSQTFGLEASTGAVWAWGENGAGQLGLGDIVSRSTPTIHSTGRSCTFIAAGNGRYFSIEGSTGRIWGWGFNGNAGLGLGTNVANLNYSVPQAIVDTRSFSAVAGATNYNAVCAIEGSTGRLWSWGANTHGSLGIGQTIYTFTAASYPVSVFGGRSYSDILMSDSALYAFEASTGSLFGWPAPKSVQLQIDCPGVPTPLDLTYHGLRSWAVVTLGCKGGGAIEASTGIVYVWGDAYTLGRGSVFASSSLAPRPVLGGRSYSKLSICLPGANSFSTPMFHAIEGSTGYLWAAGSGGTLGLGATSSVTSPTLINNGRSYSQICHSDNIDYGPAAYAIEGSTGQLWAWGANTAGQLGINSTANQSTPTSVAGGRSWKQVTTNFKAATVAAIEASTGLIFTWGANFSGCLGNNSTANVLSPTSILGGKSYSKVAAVGGDPYGSTTSFAAIEASTGLIWTWGLDDGYLGQNAAVTAKSSPIAVVGGRSFVDIVGNRAAYYAIEGSTGHLYGWGANNISYLMDSVKYLLGLGETQNFKIAASTPVLISSAKSWKGFFGIGSTNTLLGFAQDQANGIYYWGAGGRGSRAFGFFYPDAYQATTEAGFSSPVQIIKYRSSY